MPIYTNLTVDHFFSAANTRWWGEGEFPYEEDQLCETSATVRTTHGQVLTIFQTGGNTAGAVFGSQNPMATSPPAPVVSLYAMADSLGGPYFPATTPLVAASDNDIRRYHSGEFTGVVKFYYTMHPGTPKKVVAFFPDKETADNYAKLVFQLEKKCECVLTETNCNPTSDEHLKILRTCLGLYQHMITQYGSRRLTHFSRDVITICSQILSTPIPDMTAPLTTGSVLLKSDGETLVNIDYVHNRIYVPEGEIVPDEE